MSKRFVMSLAVFFTFGASLAEAVDPLKCERILILGDSITHAGHYTVDLEIGLRLATETSVPDVINLGLPSETCSGLSERSHPFPRPNVHSRLDNALAKVMPDLVIVCYGMNDGIYHPFSKDRFAAYQDGIQKLVTKVQATGAKVILLTPPPFDPVPLKAKPGKLQPPGAARYDWRSVADTYDQVIKTYADWILQNTVGADQVIDVHTATVQFLAEQRKSKPSYFFAADGVHLNAEGHQVLANAILAKWNVKPVRNPPPELQKLVRQKERLMHDAWLSEVGHTRPGMKKGLPIERALKQRAKLNAQIKAL